MEIQYFPDEEFAAKRHELGAQLGEQRGHFRWIAKREDGSQYMIRPESGRKADEENG